jgi:hypothetical protein
MLTKHDKQKFGYYNFDIIYLSVQYKLNDVALWESSAPIEPCTRWLRVTSILPVCGCANSNLCVVSRCYFPEKETYI